MLHAPSYRAQVSSFVAFAACAGACALLGLAAPARADVVVDASIVSMAALSGPNFAVSETDGAVVGNTLYLSFATLEVGVGETLTITGPANVEHVVIRVTGAAAQFDGVVTSAQMPGYLQQLDALVLASRTLPNWKEQFGRVLIEAMACEVAVVGANSGEIPNVIGEAGLIFPENDEMALHHHLLNLMQSATLRDDLGANGRQRVLNHYTQSQIAHETVAVYHKMINNASDRTISAN